MGITIDLDDLTEDEIDALLAADDLLADVLADFSRDFHKINETNREIAGGEYVPFSVSIDGRTFYSGRGAVFPTNQLSSYFAKRDTRKETRDKVREIIVTWLWGKIAERALAAGIRKGFAAIGTLVGADIEAGDVFRAARLARRLTKGKEEEPTEFDVLVWIAQELVASSPVLTGAYSEAHTLYADGSEVGSAQSIIDGAEIPAAETYIFASQSEYGRKIENKFGFHVYESVAASAQRVFPDVYIAFEWFDSPTLPGLPTGKRPYRYPSITVTPR